MNHIFVSLRTSHNMRYFSKQFKDKRFIHCVDFLRIEKKEQIKNIFGKILLEKNKQKCVFVYVNL